MEARFESADLEAWMQDLVNVPVRLMPALRPVISKGALNIKKDAAARFEAQRVGGYLPHYSRSISYDLADTSSGVEAVIGPESDKPQGGMGAAIEYGSAQHAPIPHLNPALDAEDPKAVDAIGSVGVRVLS